MFGIGPQEVVIIVLLVVVVFGPAKAASMLRDLGRFTNEARRPLEELKSELLDSEEVKEARHTIGEVKSEVASSIEEFKDEAQHSVGSGEEYKKKSEVAVSPESDDEPAAGDPVGDPLSDDEAKEVAREPKKPKEVREPPLAEQTYPAEQQQKEENKKKARTQKESEQPDADSEEFSLGGLGLGSRRGGHKRSRNRFRWGRLFGGGS